MLLDLPCHPNETELFKLTRRPLAKTDVRMFGLTEFINGREVMVPMSIVGKFNNGRHHMMGVNVDNTLKQMHFMTAATSSFEDTE